MRQNVKRVCGARRAVKYPGIRPVSRALGVTPAHLWKCLEGHRRGRAGLVESYWAIAQGYKRGESDA